MTFSAANEAARIVRYGAVGGLSLVVHVAVAVALVEQLGWRAVPASAGGWFSELVVSFLGHHYVTFRSPRSPAETAPQFLGLAAGSLALNTTLSWGGVHVAGLPAAASAGTAAIVAAAVNYLVARRLFGAARPQAQTTW